MLRHPAALSLRHAGADELCLRRIGSVRILLVPVGGLSRPGRICSLCRLLGVHTAGRLLIGGTVLGISLLWIGRIPIRILSRTLNRITVLHGLLRRIAVLYGIGPSGVYRLLRLNMRLILGRTLRITALVSGGRILGRGCLRSIRTGRMLGNRIAGGRNRLLGIRGGVVLLLVKEAHFIAG